VLTEGHGMRVRRARLPFGGDGKVKVHPSSETADLADRSSPVYHLTVIKLSHYLQVVVILVHYGCGCPRV